MKQRFEAANPTLKAAQLAVVESRANEVTAYLRPNPNFTLSSDGTQIASNQGIWRPFSGTQYTPSINYLHERDRKRELRRDSAGISTEVAASTYADQERTLTFNLRNAFVSTLQAKAVLDNARENLDYWNRTLEVNRARYDAGDLAQVDMERLELQLVQFESDFQTAMVNVRANKIQLLMLMNDRTPVDRFDVSGTYDFSEKIAPLEDLHKTALDTRPDLKAARQNVDLAKSNHLLAVANGSTDPTFSGWYSYNPSFANPYANQTVGASISIPLRIFDRNQGEKARTEVDIGRSQRLLDASQAQVFSDVDSAYFAVVSTINLLKPYRDKYLSLATEVRDRMSFSYRNGGASLIEYLDAEKSYRDTRLAYLNLVGSYLTAAAQVNLAVGREVVQ